MTIDYHTLRAFADSWGLIFMLVFFAGVIVWVLRPSLRSAHDEAASIPFKED